MRRSTWLLSLALVAGLLAVPVAGIRAQAETGCVLTGTITGATVAAGTTCEVLGLVEASGSVIVRGTLEFANGATLRFINVDEKKFRGGGGDHPSPEVYGATDIGLWVADDGMLDTSACRDVTGWNRAGTDATWLATDQLVTSPVDLLDDVHHPYVLGDPVPRYSGPGSDLVPPAEVLNLTRSCAIEGTSTGYAHVMFNGHMPQTITNLRLQYLGVDRVLGRYPLHFHHMSDMSRGSLVENVLVLNSKLHAFVTHASHGITVRDSVALYVGEAAFWWDSCSTSEGSMAASNDIIWDHDYAGDINVVTGPGDTGSHRLAAFDLGCGVDPTASGNSVVNSACSVVRGTKDASCFFWPESQSSSNTLWEPFTGNVAHNSVNGIFVWQNRTHQSVHHISDFTAYANGSYAVDAGAYRNAYTYDDVIAVGNGQSAIGLHGFSANESMPEDPALWDDWTVVGSPAVTVLPAATDNRCCPIQLSGTFDSGFPLVIRQDPQPDELRIVIHQDGEQVYPVDHTTPDITPPTAPSNLVSTSVTPSLVAMAWSPATDIIGVDHYVIRRDGVDIGTTNTAATFVDESVGRTFTYSYTVVAVDAAGNVSAPSNTLVVTIPADVDITPPSTPTNLVATLAGDDVNLTWGASTDDVGVTQYVIERDGADIATSTTASYLDPDRPAGITHTYVVYAEDLAGNRSPASNTQTVTIPSSPDPVAQFTASATTVSVGQVITFTDAHTGSHRRLVTFGDGSSLSTRSQTFTKSYGTPGTYVVTLQTVDLLTGLRGSLSLTITVQAPTGILSMR